MCPACEEMNQMLSVWAVRNNVQLALVTTIEAASNLHISAHEVAAERIPLCRDLLEMIHVAIDPFSGYRPRSCFSHPSNLFFVVLASWVSSFWFALWPGTTPR